MKNFYNAIHSYLNYCLIRRETIITSGGHALKKKESFLVVDTPVSRKLTNINSDSHVLIQEGTGTVLFGFFAP